MTTKKKPLVVKKQCSTCETEQPLSNYYNSSMDDVFADGKCPICKNCCETLITEKGFEGFQKVMKLINKPIYTDLYDGDYKKYIRIMNSIKQYSLNVYEDSTLFDERKRVQSVSKTKLEKLSKEELDELVDFFGEGYEEKDYIYLSTEYEDYLNRYEVDSKTLENLIKEICLTQLEVRIKRASGEKVDAQLKTLQDLLGSSNLKPVQETGNQAVEQETFGTLVKRWEQERPVPEPLESWYQENDVGKYLRVWFTGHLMRMFGLENKNEAEYKEELNQYTIEKKEEDERNE